MVSTYAMMIFTKADDLHSCLLFYAPLNARAETSGTGLTNKSDNSSSPLSRAEGNNAERPFI